MIEAECIDFIARKICNLYKKKDIEIDWLSLRCINSKDIDEMQIKIENYIDEGDLSEGTTVEIFQKVCDHMQEVDQGAKDCSEAKASSIIRDKNIDNESITDDTKKSAWTAYKNKLLNEKHFSELSVKIIEMDTEKIRKRLSSTYDPEIKAIKGMVVGAVQSGKTANMGALISQCADNGWNFFIILGGMIENLRYQTEVRMIDDLSGNGRYKWTPLSSICDNVEQHNHKLEKLDLSELSRDRYLCIALKQKDRLNNLIKWIKRDPANAKNLRVLIIDDEADQASVNTADITKFEKKTIYEKIDQIVNGFGKDTNREQFCGAMNYVCYTATPYANFLNDSDVESLYPNNFIATLTPPKSYFGPQEIFGVDQDGFEGLSIIRNIDSKDKSLVKSIYKNESLDMPSSLEQSLLWFLCVVSARRLKKSHKPYSMLINVSQKINDHEAISNVIEKWFKENSVCDIIMKARLLWIEEVDKFSKTKFIEEFPTYENIKSIEDYPKFNEFEQYLREMLKNGVGQIIFNEKNDFEYNNGIHLCVDNYKNNKLTENSEYRRLLYPNKKQIEQMIAPAFIVIGGNTLSRGLTIEGLVSTYFLRTGNQADSLMQMGRWFGYRFGYELYPRIWMDKKTEEQFNFISKLDYDLRQNLNNYMNLNVSPREVGPLINNTPAVSWLRITAKNKQQSVINATYDYTGIQAQTISFDEDLQVLKDNVEHTKHFLNGLNEPARSRSKSSYVWKKVNVDNILTFLEDFKFCQSNRLFNDISVFAKWLNDSKGNKNCDEWNVVLAGINEGDTWKLNDTIEINKVTRSRKIKVEDYINIGVLRSYRDNFEDIEDSELKSYDDKIDSKIKSPKEDNKKRNFFDFKKEIGFDVKPMLVIYVIDGKPKNYNKSEIRRPLDLEEDLIGIYLAVPGEHKNHDSVSQITIRIDDVEANYYDED